MKLFLIMLAVVVSSANPDSATQTDWSGYKSSGYCVQNWGTTFESNSGTDWVRSGQLTILPPTTLFAPANTPTSGICSSDHDDDGYPDVALCLNDSYYWLENPGTFEPA
ncbi:MAG: hypothetical protein QUS11_08690 [Candidatus Fermentibacter sp.]|nr:hypothetical protein [Candidatus Fermentibacter sp.]